MTKITEIMLLQQAEQHACIIRNQGDINSFSKLIGQGFKKIGDYLDELGELPADIPFAEYPAYEAIDEKNISFITGFYTAKSLPERRGIQSIIIPSRKVVACLHKGTYNELALLYEEIADWISSKGFTPNGSSVEHYYTGPNVPESEHITRIIIPVR